MREKLIDVLGDFPLYPSTMRKAWMPQAVEKLADHLIANGVTVTDTNVGKWIPVTERLPEENERVLVWVGENDCYFPSIDTDRLHNGRWVRWDGYITHWMPLPPALEEEK